MTAASLACRARIKTGMQAVVVKIRPIHRDRERDPSEIGIAFPASSTGWFRNYSKSMQTPRGPRRKDGAVIDVYTTAVDIIILTDKVKRNLCVFELLVSLLHKYIDICISFFF